jgi:hypothetical protein
LLVAGRWSLVAGRWSLVAGRWCLCSQRALWFNVGVSTDFGIDLDEVRRVIDAADVLVVRFTVTDRRLLIDVRTNETDGPMVRIVPPVTSAQERFKALKIMRPRFRSPERILTFHWPRHARAMVEAGLWDHIARRVVSAGGGASAPQCDEALRELLAAERAVEIAAITGAEGFKTIWGERGEGDA